MSRRSVRFLAALSIATSPAASLGAQVAGHPERPKLIVFFTVDQMRSDYVDRWAPQLSGGLARLAKHGAVFTNAFQDHAVTETAPGHSVVLSGRFPRSTGIMRNSAGVEDPQAPLLTSRDAPASPYRFRGSVLIDWLRTSDARSRALSISRKDRGAILPMGRAKQNVFWYATSIGEFTTSRYYADTLPTWVREVNARRVPQRAAGREWTLLLPASSYTEPDSVPEEYNGRDVAFPHRLPSDMVRVASEFPYTPWMDQLTLDAALAGLRTLDLGTGPQTDVLAISLSGTDYIGHRYGPDSREQHDNIVRLDRAMGAFIDSLFKLRDSASIVFALSADHGATSYPELVARRAGRMPPARYDFGPALRELRGALRAARVDTTAAVLEAPFIFANRQAFADAGVSPDPILAQFASALRRAPGIARVDRVRDLARMDTLRNAVTRRWVHMLVPDSGAEYVITPVEGAYDVSARIAEHGTPYDDDAHVPVIFWGRWFRAGRFGERALVADIAPTLARVAGTTPTEKLDGRVLERALATPPSSRP